jgi:hypothetical protein
MIQHALIKDNTSAVDKINCVINQQREEAAEQQWGGKVAVNNVEYLFLTARF